MDLMRKLFCFANLVIGNFTIAVVVEVFLQMRSGIVAIKWQRFLISLKKVCFLKTDFSGNIFSRELIPLDNYGEKQAEKIKNDPIKSVNYGCDLHSYLQIKFDNDPKISNFGKINLSILLEEIIMVHQNFYYQILFLLVWKDIQ